MKFASLEEYFYKLQNILLLLLLAPLLGFTYIVLAHLKASVVLDNTESVVTGLLIFIAVADWIFVTFLFKNMANKISKQIGLNLKLERYYVATLIRCSVSVTSCLILVFGFYLTSNSIFTVFFSMAIILFFVTWPRPAKVCADLKLKGDEKEMVLYKKHSL